MDDDCLPPVCKLRFSPVCAVCNRSPNWAVSEGQHANHEMGRSLVTEKGRGTTSGTCRACVPLHSPAKLLPPTVCSSHPDLTTSAATATYIQQLLLAVHAGTRALLQAGQHVLCASREIDWKSAARCCVDSSRPDSSALIHNACAGGLGRTHPALLCPRVTFLLHNIHHCCWLPGQAAQQHGRPSTSGVHAPGHADP